MGATAAPPPPRVGQRRQVTVLFADLTGFTSLSARLDPEETHALLERYFTAVDAAVRTHGGHVDKHIGDAVMAVFGAPVAHPDDPQRAVRAALAMQAAVARLEPPLRLHAGVASGVVVASPTGSDTHREYTVIGDSVNLAARLMDAAPAGETWLTAPFAALVSDVARCSLVGARTFKGVAGPIEVWRALELAPEAPVDPILVGRVRERERLGRLLTAGGVVVLSGEPGMGKSSLLRAVSDDALRSGANVVAARCLDFGQDPAEGPVVTITKQLIAGVPPGHLEPEQVALCAEVVGAPSRPLAEADPVAREAVRREALVALLRAMAQSGPTWVTVEDLHWAAPLERARLDAWMAAETPGVAWLLTTRPGVSAPAGATVVDLGPLEPDEARALVARWVPPERIEGVVTRAAGHPLFLEQLARHSTRTEDLPGTLRSVVQARTDRLAPADRAVLQAASVIGQEASAELLSWLVGSDVHARALLEEGLLRREGASYVFAHALVREVVYAGLLRDPRRALHRRAAEWFAPRDPYRTAEHLEGAGDPGAPVAWASAGAAARSVGDRATAAAALRRCAALASDPVVGGAAYEALGAVLTELGEGADALAAWEAACELAGDSATLLRVWLGLAGALREAARPDEALALLDRIEALAAQVQDRAASARAATIRGSMAFARGAWAVSAEAHGRARDLAAELRDAPLLRRAMSGLADAAYANGYLAEAARAYRDLVDDARRTGDLAGEVANLPMVAHTLVLTAGPRAALDVAEQAATLARRVHARRAEMVALHAVAIVAIELEDFDRAAEAVARAAVIARRLTSTMFEVEAWAIGARFERALGRADEVRARLAAAWEILPDWARPYCGLWVCGEALRVAVDEQDYARWCARAEACGPAMAVTRWLYLRDRIDAELDRGDVVMAQRAGRWLGAADPGAPPSVWTAFARARLDAIVAHRAALPGAEAQVDAVRRSGLDLGFVFDVRRLPAAPPPMAP